MASNPQQKSSANGQKSQPGQYKTMNEYASVLRQWMFQCQWNQAVSWTNMAMPMYTMGMMAGASQHSSLRSGQIPSWAQAPQISSTQPRVNRQQQQQQPQQYDAIPLGREYKIPPLWKRVAAEFIDFLLLFVIKLALTMVAIEYFNIIDIEKWGKYDLDALFKQNLDMSTMSTAFNITSELIAMEVVNRIFVTIFEALCLRQGLQGIPGGTTPGKRAMGLAVVTCQRAINLDPHTVLVRPAGDLGFVLAFVRSLLKNFSMAFFFPASFTVFIFNHNRALYDVVAGCIVVEQAY